MNNYLPWYSNKSLKAIFEKNEIGHGLGRILSCGERIPEQT